MIDQTFQGPWLHQRNSHLQILAAIVADVVARSSCSSLVSSQFEAA